MISNCLVMVVITAMLSGFVLYTYMSASHPTIGVSDVAMRGSCSVTSRREQIVNTCRKETIVKPKYLDTIITDDRHRVLYCVIPKVAGTSFKSMMVDNLGIQTELKWFLPGYMNTIGLKQLSQYSQEDISERLESYFKFMVVRHPFDRLVSTYQQKFGGFKSQNLGNTYQNFASHHKDVIHDHFGNISHVDSNGQKLLSWPQFLELVVSEPKRFSDNHWANYENLCDPCKVNYSHVVYMETMEDDLDIVLDQLTDANGHRPALPTRNTIRNTTDNTDTLSQYFKNIDPDILNRLFKIYGRDLEMFGYTWNSDSGGTYPKNRC